MVSNVIGVGIFTTPGIVAQLVPQPWAMLAVWLAGGVLAFAGARVYGELGRLRPYAGGEYVYLREAFGPLAGFLTGWTSFIAGFSGAIAAGAIGLATYLGRVVPAAGDSHPFLTVPVWVTRIEISPRTVVALALILMLSAVHVRGLGPGKAVQNLLAGLAVLALLLLVGLGFTLGKGSTAHFATGGEWHARGWLLALIPVMFTYSGWNAAAYVVEEIRRPERNLARALALGTAVVTALYLALNVLYLYALPASRLQGVISAGDSAAVALFGERGAMAMTLLVCIALAGGISAMIIAGPRVYFAMARDGVFLPAAARIHPRYHTPAVAILAQALWSCVLVITGGFEQLVIYTGFAVVLFSGAAAVALFVLRRGPQAQEASQAGTLAAVVFIPVSAAMLVSAIVERPATAGAGLLLMGLGVPVFWWFRRRSGGSKT